MTQLRYVERVVTAGEEPKRILQYRTLDKSITTTGVAGLESWRWSGWVDVPFVSDPEEEI